MKHNKIKKQVQSFKINASMGGVATHTILLSQRKGWLRKNKQNNTHLGKLKYKQRANVPPKNHPP